MRRPAWRVVRRASSEPACWRGGIASSLIPCSGQPTSGGTSQMFVFKAAVVGGGTMGGEIAQVIAAADIPVVLKDVDQKFVDHALEKAREVTEGQLDRLVKKEKLTQEQADARLDEVMGLITGTTDLRRVRRRRLRDRGGAREDGDQAGGLRRARRGHARATRSSPPTPPRSRSPRWARRRCGPTRSSASTSSTRPR